MQAIVNRHLKSQCGKNTPIFFQELGKTGVTRKMVVSNLELSFLLQTHVVRALKLFLVLSILHRVPVLLTLIIKN